MVLAGFRASAVDVPVQLLDGWPLVTKGTDMQDLRAATFRKRGDAKLADCCRILFPPDIGDGALSWSSPKKLFSLIRIRTFADVHGLVCCEAEYSTSLRTRPSTPLPLTAGWTSVGRCMMVPTPLNSMDCTDVPPDTTIA